MVRRFALMTILASLLLLPAAEAQYVYQSDGGFFDLQVDKKGKLKKQKILWVWVPHYAPGSVRYEIFAFCFRQDVDGQGVGNNKVTFQGISFLGGGAQLFVPKLTGKMKNGAHETFLSREVANLGTVAAVTAVVIGEATVAVKGKLKEGDRMYCQIDVTESP